MNMYRMAMTVKYLWRVSKKKRREGLTKSGECEFCSIMGRLRCKGCYCWYCSPVCQVRHQPVHTPACQPSQKTLQALILPDGSRYARSIGRGGAANLETGFSFLPNNYVKEVKRRISDLKHEPLSEVPCGWIVTEQTHKYRMCKLKFQRTRGLKAIKAIKSHDNYQDSYILLNLPHILERTKETDEQVRRAASKFLAGNVHIKSLTMGQREGVLDRGLGEKSEAMRRVVEKMIPLLPAIQDEEVMRAKQLQIVKLRVELNLLRDQLVESVTGKNFLIAQQIKVQMVRLKEEQAMMEDQLSTSKAIGAAPPASASPIDPTPAAAAAATAAQLDLNDYAAPVLDNPAVTLKCLRLLVASLQDPSIIQLNSTLLTLLDMVSVQSELPAIRKEAITAMACCCLGSLENVRQHMLLLLQAAHIDVHEVRITAIIALVDLLMKHGLSSFITQEESDLDVSGGNSSADRLISHINIDMAMESELPTRGGTLTQLELRTEVAEGLCKLLVIGSINNPKLLSNLLLIWYNPMTESDSKLRHILGIFFPLYSSMSKPHQLAMEAAFIPTMRVLFDAPVPSPLNEIDTEDVGMFFVHLTREDMLHTFDANKKDINIFESSSTTTTVHDSLALSVCHGILSSPDSFQTKVLIKILTSLALTHNNYVHLKELKVLAELLLQNVKEKSCVRTLERFDKQLMDWMAKDPATNINDTPRANKRKSKGGADESPDESGTLTPTRSKKRILFSQSMIVNPLPNPESGHILETTSEEDVLTTLGDESLGISPMVVGNTRVDRCSQELDVEKTMVKNVFPLWIFSSHSIVFGVRKLFYVVTKTTLKLKKLFVGWILKERDGNFDLLRAGDVESNPGPGGYDVEQTIKIDGNAPKEIYYYQQISSRVLQMFNSPWGVVMKNCQADGKLVDFSNMAAFETFRKEERKQMWLHLPLKVFQINSNVLMGVFVCPECPSMAGMMEQEAAQDSVSIIKCLCMHSRVATMRIGDWRKEWTVSMSPSNLTFYVNHEEDANCVVLIPKSSKTAFLAAVLSKSKVYLLYCATVRQDLPFCSHCTTRKCCHYSSLVGFESSHAPNPAGEGEEENYEPLHDVEENDLNYNEHYMKKPPIHVRGSMYGYNFEEIIYPFSESPEQQRVWLQRVAGLVSIPPRLEPTVDNESKCKHNMPYNNRSDALVVESKTVCLFNDIGERIISSEVFARPSLGPCKCLKRFDGNKHLIWHLGGGRFVDYSTLHSYLHKWRSSGMAMYSLYRSIVDGAESCGISCSLTYSDIHRAVSGFFVNLVFNVHKAFSCPTHGTSPRWLVSDGKACGPLKRRVNHIQELDVAPNDDSVLPQSTHYHDRIFLNIKKERDVLRQLLSGNVSMDEFMATDDITSPNGMLVIGVVFHIKAKSPLKIPEPYVAFLSNISKNSSVRSLMQVTNLEHLDTLAEYCKEELDLRIIRNKDKLKALIKTFPALWPILDSICRIDDIKFLPRAVSKVILKMLKIRLSTFENATKRSNSDYYLWPDQSVEHPSQCYPTLPLWKYPSKYRVSDQDDSDLCHKAFTYHGDFSAGVYSVGCACPANITFGFELMILKESPRNLFRFLMTRDIDVEALDGILVDHACLFEPYMMNREAKLLEKINVLVDGSHWQGMRKLKKGDRSGKGGHIGCSEGFNFNLYKQHLDMEVNSQGREQMHSLLEKCTQSLRLLSYRHFMIFLRVFFATTNLHNRKYK